jgi:hypothetical protein
MTFTSGWLQGPVEPLHSWDYSAVKDDKEALEDRISRLEATLRDAEVVDAVESEEVATGVKPRNDGIGLGSTPSLRPQIACVRERALDLASIVLEPSGPRSPTPRAIFSVFSSRPSASAGPRARTDRPGPLRLRPARFREERGLSTPVNTRSSAKRGDRCWVHRSPVSERVPSVT